MTEIPTWRHADLLGTLNDGGHIRPLVAGGIRELERVAEQVSGIREPVEWNVFKVFGHVGHGVLSGHVIIRDNRFGWRWQLRNNRGPETEETVFNGRY